MGFKEIGRKIQRAREEKGLTQAELAQALGVTQAGLSNYELGKRRIYLHQIERIAGILGKDIRYFVANGETQEDAPHGSPPDPESIVQRVRTLAHNDLEELSLFLDFLAWRRRRD